MALSRTDIGKTSVSVVMPAFNEAGNLAATIESVRKAFNDKFSSYEIIIVNDGSSDDTGNIAEDLARQDTHIKVIHNSRNMGYGYTFLRGVKAANCEYVQLIPADGEIPQESIEIIAAHVGEADLILPYFINFQIRPMVRRIVSWCYTSILNILFWHNIRYYNGPFFVRTNLLRTVNVNTQGFAFMASIVLRLLKHQVGYIQVGVTLAPRSYGRSSLSPGKILRVLSTITWLWLDINFGWKVTVKK